MSTFDDLTEDQKTSLRNEFNNPDTTRNRRVGLLTYLREGANEAQMGRPCPRCKNYPFLAPHGEALIEGHVYSHDGMVELGITGYCEFCFDEIMRDPEEEMYPREGDIIGQRAEDGSVVTYEFKEDVKYPEIEVELTGQDGNAIVDTVQKALRRHGVDREEINKFSEEAMPGDYDNLLRTASRWVSVS